MWVEQASNEPGIREGENRLTLAQNRECICLQRSRLGRSCLAYASVKRIMSAILTDL